MSGVFELGNWKRSLSVQRRVHRCRRRSMHSVCSREVQDYHRQLCMPRLRRGKVFDCNWRFFRRNLPDLSGVFELGNRKQSPDQLSVQRRVHGCRRRAVHSVRSRDLQTKYRFHSLHVVCCAHIQQLRWIAGYHHVCAMSFEFVFSRRESWYQSMFLYFWLQADANPRFLCTVHSRLLRPPY
jgi:hypothetical protein